MTQPIDVTAAPWRKSSASEGAANCVEGAAVGNTALVRDTKDRARGHVLAAPRAWATFIAALRD